MLNKVTQNESERAYVLQTYDSELYEVKQKWISGDANDCWATPGDIVRRLELVPSGVDKNKVEFKNVFATVIRYLSGFGRYG